MQVNIYNAHSIKHYRDKFAKWTESLDIYYDPAFLSCDAVTQKGEFEIFTAQKGNEIFIYPYIKLPIQGYSNHFDLSSPYGYAGPFCTDNSLLSEAENAFTDYISRAGCVTEFVRYHYLYNEEMFFSKKIQNIHNRDVVIADLSKGWDYLWANQYSGTNRNLIRRMEKEGFKANFHTDTEHIDIFIGMYNLTMKNANADPFYFFPRDFYYQLFEGLGKKIGLVNVVKDDRIYASSLFLHSGNILTYYLSARDVDNAKVPSSNLMLSEMARYGIERNVSTFNLGGGTTHSESDSLFKFKRNFSKSMKKFYIGKRIHEPVIYGELKQIFIRENGEEVYNEKKKILQFYRN